MIAAGEKNVLTDAGEQRMWSRFQIDVPIQVTTDLGEQFSAQCLDWSSHGLKFRAQRPMAFTQAARLQVEATQPGIVDLEVAIEVQRCDPEEGSWVIGAHVVDIR